MPMSRTTSSPVLPGICTSRKTRSGLRFRMASTAATPLSISPTILTPFAAWSISAMRWRASGSSSTMRTRNASAPAIATRVKWKHDFGVRAALLCPAQLDFVGRPVHLAQSRVAVGESHPFLPSSRPRPVVGHRDDQVLASLARVHRDRPYAGDLVDAVLHRVLDNRLD